MLFYPCTGSISHVAHSVIVNLWYPSTRVKATVLVVNIISSISKSSSSSRESESGKKKWIHIFEQPI